MFIELLDLLRCTNAHEDTWLVASFKTVSNRFVMDGTLGCPTCSAKYSITSLRRPGRRRSLARAVLRQT